MANGRLSIAAKRIAIIGAGHIGTALARGFLAAGKSDAEHLVATIPSEEKAADLRGDLGIEVTTSNPDPATRSERMSRKEEGLYDGPWSQGRPGTPDPAQGRFASCPPITDCVKKKLSLEFT